MPPAITPLRVNVRILSAVNSVSTSPSAFLTPLTSVKSNRRSAVKAAAIEPATVSPLILKVSPSRPEPNGAITGIISLSNRVFSTVVSTSAGVPTRPSAASVWSQISKLASFPDSPTARPPWAFIAWTIRLLTRPDRTISTTSIVLASVTRLPCTNSDAICNLSSIALIIGPPPCTMTGLIPTCRISTTSRAKVSMAASLPIAWPPSLMTTIAPS